MLLRIGRLAAVAVCLLLAACTPTMNARVADDLTPASLASERHGVALLTADVAGRGCRAVGILIGVRENGLYRNVTSLGLHHASGRHIGEIKLAAGEYHIVAFHCVNGNKRAQLTEEVMEQDGGKARFKRAYATFTVQAGEIVNIGYLKVTHLAMDQDARAIVAKVGVEGMPAAYLEKFKMERPHLYGKMRTRLMRHNPR